MATTPAAGSGRTACNSAPSRRRARGRAARPNHRAGTHHGQGEFPIHPCWARTRRRGPGARPDRAGRGQSSTVRLQSAIDRVQHRSLVGACASMASMSLKAPSMSSAAASARPANPPRPHRLSSEIDRRAFAANTNSGDSAIPTTCRCLSRPFKLRSARRRAGCCWRRQTPSGRRVANRAWRHRHEQVFTITRCTILLTLRRFCQ